MRMSTGRDLGEGLLAHQVFDQIGLTVMQTGERVGAQAGDGSVVADG
jgi:type II secretory pathway component PulF